MWQAYFEVNVTLQDRLHLAWQGGGGVHVGCREPAGSDLSTVPHTLTQQCHPGGQERRSMPAQANFMPGGNRCLSPWPGSACLADNKAAMVCSGKSLLQIGSPWDLSPWLGCAHHGSRAGPHKHRALCVQLSMESHSGELWRSCGQLKQLGWLGLQGVPGGGFVSPCQNPQEPCNLECSAAIEAGFGGPGPAQISSAAGGAGVAGGSTLRPMCCTSCPPGGRRAQLVAQLLATRPLRPLSPAMPARMC